MIIRKQLLETLAATRLEAFISRMTVMLKNHFPQWSDNMARNGSSLDALVRAATQEAAEFGLVDESDLETYIQCLPLLGVTFATGGSAIWARAILHRDDLIGTEKMDRIHNYLVFGGSGRKNHG